MKTDVVQKSKKQLENYRSKELGTIKCIKETIKCITEHEDYQSLTKEVVLMYIGPLLEDKQGRSHKQKAG